MLDIVIPVRNATEYFRNCVDTIEANTLDQNTKSFRFIIVDDFSDPEHAEVIRATVSRFSNALYIRTQKQRWFSRASNIGLRLVNSEWCVLINSDCTVAPGWMTHLDSIRDDFQAKHPEKRLGVIGHHNAGPNSPSWDEQFNPSYVTGHLLFFHTPTIREISVIRGTPGLIFDERYQEGIHIATDRWLSWEMNKLGISPIYAYGDWAAHHGGKSWNYNTAKVAHLRLVDVND